MQNFPHLTGMKIGTSVVFGRPNGEQTKGIIVKINRKSVSVEQTEVRTGQGRIRSVGTIWKVHPSCLRLEGGSAPTPTPQTSDTRIFSRGEKVSFRHNGEIIEGFVKSVNTKTISVEPHKGANRYWRVPHSLFI